MQNIQFVIATRFFRAFRTCARTAVVSSAISLSTVPAFAQDSLQGSLLRAVNTTRMRAEALNGGLSKYRSAACMYSSTGDICLVLKEPRGFIFRFLGGTPGWQQMGIPASVETEIATDAEGKNIVAVFYNGPPRK